MLCERIEPRVGNYAARFELSSVGGVVARRQGRAAGSKRSRDAIGGAARVKTANQPRPRSSTIKQHAEGLVVAREARGESARLYVARLKTHWHNAAAEVNTWTDPSKGLEKRSGGNRGGSSSAGRCGPTRQSDAVLRARKRSQNFVERERALVPQCCVRPKVALCHALVNASRGSIHDYEEAAARALVQIPRSTRQPAVEQAKRRGASC